MTLIRLHLEYASQVWDPYLVKDCKLLEDGQEFDVSKKLEHNIPWNAGHPKLEQRRKALKLCFMHKLVETNAPVLVPLIHDPVYTPLGTPTLSS